MESDDQRRIEVLVIRAWSEADEFRARITRMRPLDDTDEESVVVASPDRIIAEVDSWLNNFTGADGP